VTDVVSVLRGMMTAAGEIARRLGSSSKSREFAFPWTISSEKSSAGN